MPSRGPGAPDAGAVQDARHPCNQADVRGIL